MNCLDLPGALRRCLCTTNVIESRNSVIRRRASRWKVGSMVMRSVSTAWIESEESFSPIIGYEMSWMLKSFLDSSPGSEQVAPERNPG